MHQFSTRNGLYSTDPNVKEINLIEYLFFEYYTDYRSEVIMLYTLVCSLPIQAELWHAVLVRTLTVMHFEECLGNGQVVYNLKIFFNENPTTVGLSAHEI